MNNLTFAFSSDRSDVSVGARNDYSDCGNLVATAVLFRSPANRLGDPEWAYRAARVEILMGMRPAQAPRSLSDFLITLYADDGSDEHSPGTQLSAPWPLSGLTSTLSTSRATWQLQDVTQAGWPALKQKTYYWIVITPGATLSLPAPNTRYNGALWTGVSDDAMRPSDNTPILPSWITDDLGLFTGRQLTSQRFSGDSQFCANAPAAVNFLKNVNNWANVSNVSPRYTNFATANVSVRYGIQILGWQVTPSSSPSTSRE